RVVDRIGQTPVLVACSICFPASVAALIVVAGATSDTVPMLACATASGLSFPPLFATLRALMSTLAGGLVETAFALEAMLQEVFFIVGPLLVAVIVALASAQAALVAAAVLVAAATLAFASTTPSRRWVGAGPRQGRAGAFASAGVRTIVITS